MASKLTDQDDQKPVMDYQPSTTETVSSQFEKVAEQGSKEASSQSEVLLNEEKENPSDKIESVNLQNVSSTTAPFVKDLPTKSSNPSPKKAPHPNYNLLRFPLRVGITWRKGEKLEAMDFSRTWYPSKIVEIDEEEKYVLIHFEGWNARYDEWVPMDSEKLRPQTRHSERKDKTSKKRRNLPHPCPVQDIFRTGEHVLARWTDCKKYPATVNKPVEDGSYEVVFYDGVTRHIQPINIQPMPLEMQLAMQAAPKLAPVPAAAKPSFKDVTLKLPDHVAQARKSSEDESSLSVAVKSVSSDKMKITVSHKKHSFKKSSLKKSPLKKKKRLKALPGLVARENPLPPPIAPIIASATGTLHSASTTATLPSTSQHLAGSAIFNDGSVTADVAGGVMPEASQVVAGVAHHGQVKGLKRVRKRAHTDSSLSSKKRQKMRKTQEPQQRTSQEGAVRAKSFDLGAPTMPSVAPFPPMLPQIFVPSKAFVVEEDHNHFKCHFPGCPKGYRKENLLNYHIKYYHSDAPTPPSSTSFSQSASLSHYGPVGSPSSTTPIASGSATAIGSPLLVPSPASAHGSVPSTPVSGVRKRRKKTDSVCSTDSDMSISSRGKSSGKRQRHDSEISVTGSPDLVPREAWADVKLKGAAQDSPTEDNLEADDVDMEADLVNCICGIRESNGLMIQCDVCMSWQHFSCVDTKGTGIPPNSYVCQACEKPRGVRDSCRYMYDMGFERRGELPSFTFSSGQNHKTNAKLSHLRSLANKCNTLTSVLIGMKSALHSTRRQIKISKEEEDREFQLWQTDWDNWTKPEEDLTLTPHSVDPVPSPTPSTFLFPPTPTPPATSNTSALSPSASSAIHNGNLLSPNLNNGEATPFMLDTVSDPTTTSADSQDSASTSSAFPTALVGDMSFGDQSNRMANSSADKLSSALSIQLSPLDEAACANTEQGHSSSVTPPSSRTHMDIPSTPLSERRHAASSNKVGVSGLVCDLFPGPGGDAGSSLENERSNDRTSSAILDQEKTETGKLTPTEGLLPSPEQFGPKNLTADERIGGGKGHELHYDKDGTSEVSLMPSMATEVSAAIVNSSASTSASCRLDTISSLPFPTKLNSSSSQATAASLTSMPSTTTISSLSTVTAASTMNGIEDKHTSDKCSSNMNANCSTIGNVSSDDIQMDDATSSHLATRTGGTDSAREENKKKDFDEELTGMKKPLASEFDGDVQSSALASGDHIGQLYIDVNERQSNTDDCEEDNDTDTAEESADPYKNCEHNLLVHISNTHSDMEAQLMELENSISDLEKSNLNDPTIQLSDDNVLNDIPALRKSLRKLLQNLSKVQQLSSLC